MASPSHPDQRRIELLRAFLEAKGVDVVQTGRDLCMPSPFKEREKRRFEPGYVDTGRRLSVTVVENTDSGQSQVIWQCWYTKRPNGTNFGGRSVYAVALAAKCDQREVLQALDLAFDKEVHEAEQKEDDVSWALAVAGQSSRARDKQVHLFNKSRTDTQIIHKKRYLSPPINGIPLFEGYSAALAGEEAVLSRAISPERARRYCLGWDLDRSAVILPWKGVNGEHHYHQWWTPGSAKGYRFPEKSADFVSKEDCIFGLHTWNPSLPLILAEGAFTAMSINGCALGGSSLTLAQQAILLGLPIHTVSLIIFALDKDGAGLHGMQKMRGIDMIATTKTSALSVFAPGTGDWNDLAQAQSEEACGRIFIERVQQAAKSGLSATFQQIVS